MPKRVTKANDEIIELKEIKMVKIKREKYWVGEIRVVQIKSDLIDFWQFLLVVKWNWIRKLKLEGISKLMSSWWNWIQKNPIFSLPLLTCIMPLFLFSFLFTHMNASLSPSLILTIVMLTSLMLKLLCDYAWWLNDIETAVDSYILILNTCITMNPI